MGAPQSLIDKMRAKARAIKERQAESFNGPKAPRYDLTGKNAIVAPGHIVYVRFLPRWDYLTDRYRKNAQNKWEENPAYEDRQIFFDAKEHWWDTDDGKGGVLPRREWCLKIFDPEAACPICEATDELISKGSKEDKSYANRIKAKEVGLFNACIGKTGARKMTDQGVPDIRVLSMQDSLVGILIKFMYGDEDTDESFVRGNVADPKTGFNVELTRPGKQGERWKMDCSPNPSPLYKEEEKAAWRTWMTLMHNIPDVVKEEMLTYEGLYKTFHGVDSDGGGDGPEDAPAPAPKPAATKPAPKAAAPAPAPEPETVEEPDGGFDLPDEPATPPTPGKKPAGK